MLTTKQGDILLRLARQTVCDRLQIPVDTPVRPEELADPAFQQKLGVFVTLNKRGALRGCIGSLIGAESIVEGVRRNAVNAAFYDSRFSPVEADEAGDLNFDISVLTEPVALEYEGADDLVAKLRPDVDGVILRAPGGAGATFLPQVWKQLPQPELFLSHLCRKAGLPDVTWKSGRLGIDIYQVQHFEEKT